MGPSKVDAWARFFDHVVIRGAEWPRELWFAAVDDALDAALPARSGLLAAFRRDLEELRALERAASGSAEDARRLDQLEAQIQRLLAIGDEVIRGPEPSSSASRPTAQRRPGWGWLAAAGVASVLVVAGTVIGADHLMRARFGQQLAEMQERYDRQLSSLRSDLSERVAATERTQEHLGVLHAELSANVDEFGELMSESVTSVLTLGNSAIDELERRLTGRGGEIGQILDGLRNRAAELGEGLDRIDGELASMERRAPALGGDLDRLESDLGDARVDLSQAVAEVGALADLAPDLAAWTERERAGLEAELGDQRAALARVATEVATVEGDVVRTREVLVGFDEELAQSLTRAKQDGASLQTAADGARAVEQSIEGLVGTAENRLAGAEREMQQKVDRMLSVLAEKADLTVLRGEDAMQRAAAEARRRIETEAETTAATLATLREGTLAELAERAASTRAELEQTHASLAVGWKQMDADVAARQAAVLADLDRHAADLDDRVRAFVEALDVIVAQTASAQPR